MNTVGGIAKRQLQAQLNLHEVIVRKGIGHHTEVDGIDKKRGRQRRIGKAMHDGCVRLVSGRQSQAIETGASDLGRPEGRSQTRPIVALSPVAAWESSGDASFCQC